MTDKTKSMEALEAILESMLLDNENITARSVVRRSEGQFKNASDITRNEKRRDMLETYQAKQADLRALMAKSNKLSKESLSEQIPVLKLELEKLTRQRDILIASHKAMLLAVGEVGGMKAWKRLFEHNQTILEELSKMRAMPS